MGVLASIRSALARTLAPLAAAPVHGTGGWWPVVREPYAGAWQQNVEIRQDTVLTYSAVFACVTLIASDIGKLCLRLVEQSEDDVWVETDSPAFSPVLRKPNRYQTITKFVEQWITSKLIWGNAYVLKERDGRGVVVALYVLDPCRVTPLIAPDGSVYYQLQRNDLGGAAITGTEGTFILPAREIIHDTMVCLYHPLVGVSPIFACGLASMQGLAIQNSATTFFTNGSRPSGLLVAPAGMTAAQLAQAKTDWETFNGPGNAGKVAVITADIKYTQLTMNAVDAQLIEQLKWTAETVCSCFHVAPYMIGVGPPPPYANVEPLLQQYYSQCIQSLLVNFEKSYEEGVGILEPVNGTQYGVEFDIDDLIWMDTITKTKAAHDTISGGALSPDEARRKYFGLGPVVGGDTPYMQQQMFSLAALAIRDAHDPFATPTPAPMATPPAADQLPPSQVTATARHLYAKALEGQGRMTEAEVAAIVEGIAPVTCEAIQRATAGLVQRQLMLEAQVAQLVAAVTDTGVLRERVATLEARPPLAGPAGQDGAPGPPGKDGTDGTPGLAYRGVFVEGQTYDRGQVVTWAGGSWHCNETTTTKPGEGLKAWTLMVKRGRDGKDGKDGPSGPPGPAGRDWQQVYDDTRRR